jgi:hypothetical protein
MHVKVAGVRWRVQEGARTLDGLCDHETNRITIAPGQRQRRRLDTLIHEVMHMTRPELCEANVTAMAKVLTRVLWKDGWRRRRR